MQKYQIMAKRSQRNRGKANASAQKRPAKASPRYQGKARMTREGYIFVSVKDLDEDIYVKASKTRQALHGDTVTVALVRRSPAPGRRYEGEVISVDERSKVPLVGIMHFVGAQAWVLMQTKTMPYDVEVDQQQALDAGAQQGMKVAVLVDSFERKDFSPKGHIVDVLGMPGDNETEMHAILAEFGLPYRFEKAVEDAADSISDEITAADLQGRRDFRQTTTFTIDPADAKDFDDALSYKVLPGGNLEVGVHIADVSYYVKPGTAVDKEAQLRGTSVYLVDRTVPMLPEKLSNKLCSLRPGEDKLTFSVVFEITPHGRVMDRWFGRTVINSCRRYNYDEAQAIIEASLEAPLPPEAPAPDQAVAALHKIAQILRQKRFAAGAISFERPEMKVETDADGKPVRIYQRISKEANWLIEEFMLLANRSVAELIATDGKFNGKASDKAKTFVYRVHAEPSPEKVEYLRQFASTFGYRMGKTGGADTSRSINTLLGEAKGRPEFGALEILALRSMARATYTTNNIGHYGLAFGFYTHFTSPIRRYPDTMVHRLLSLYLDGGSNQDKEYYEEQCRHASEREQVAADAERASVKYKLVEYMTGHIGEEFEGNISGITDWGMYVEVEPTKIEGMVALREIKSDFFDFDEENYRLVGRRSARQYRLGDKVRIRVKSANLEQKLLDYELVEDVEAAVDRASPAASAPRGGYRPGKKAVSSRQASASKTKPGAKGGASKKKGGR